MNSNREVTDKQFSANTSIDGTLLDAAFEDVVEAANAVRPRHVGRRKFRQSAVLGWMPFPEPGFQLQHPWLRQFNDDSASNMVGSAPDAGVANANRVKGCHNQGIDQADVANAWIYVWTTAYAFTKPVTLDGFSLFMLRDSVYTMQPEYSEDSPPPGKTGGAPLNDLGIVIMVDDPFMPENAAANNVIFQKVGFKIDSTPFSNRAIVGVWADFTPPHPELAPVGIGIDELGLGIEIPARSRVRVCVMIPRYDLDGGLVENPWGDGGEEALEPFQSFVNPMTLHWLEAA